MAFFKRYGAVWHDLPNGDSILVNDLTKFVTFIDNFKSNPQMTLQYTIEEGEKPEDISYKLYDDVSYWWTILLLNEISDVNDQWPRNGSELDGFIAKKYPNNFPSDVHHYLTPDGLVGSPLAIKIFKNLASEDDAIVAGNLTSVSIFDHEFSLNEQKRNIILIDPDYIDLVDNAMKELLNGSS